MCTPHQPAPIEQEQCFFEVTSLTENIGPQTINGGKRGVHNFLYTTLSFPMSFGSHLLFRHRIDFELPNWTISMINSNIPIYSSKVSLVAIQHAMSEPPMGRYETRTVAHQQQEDNEPLVGTRN